MDTAQLQVAARARFSAIGIRRVGVERGPRGYIVPITVLTVLYLLFELGFNARILDVTGSLATEDEVTAIEHWGRIISGMAVTLFVWGTILMPRAWRGQWTLSHTLRILLLWTALLMTGTFFGEKLLVDWIVERSSAPTRHAAVELRLVVSAVLRGRAEIAGIDLSPAVLGSPQGKSFLALLPLQALSTRDLASKLDGPLQTIVGNEVRAVIGTVDAMYLGPFKESAAEVMRQFRSYQDKQAAAAKAGAGIAHTTDPEALWRDYVEHLELTMHVTPDNVPVLWRSGIAAEVRRQGIPVPEHWNPADHRAFITAARSAIASRTGSSAPTIPLGLDLEAFAALPQVQNPWRERLLGGSYVPEITLSPDMSREQFAQRIYEPRVAHEVQAQLERLRRPDSDFGPGGSMADEGFRAMEALIAPPVALLFSLSGGLVHLFKSIRYTITLRAPSRRRTRLAGVLVIATALLAFAAPNNVSRSQAFDDLRGGGGIGTLAARWIVQAQPFAYPVNEWVRQHILGGMSFGFHEGQG